MDETGGLTGIIYSEKIRLYQHIQPLRITEKHADTQA